MQKVRNGSQTGASVGVEVGGEGVMVGVGVGVGCEVAVEEEINVAVAVGGTGEVDPQAVSVRDRIKTRNAGNLMRARIRLDLPEFFGVFAPAWQLFYHACAVRSTSACREIYPPAKRY